MSDYKDYIDECMEWQEIYDEAISHIEQTKKFLETGMKNSSLTGKLYSWKDLVDSDGNPAYASEEEWRREEQEYIAQEQEQADYALYRLQEVKEELKSTFPDLDEKIFAAESYLKSKKIEEIICEGLMAEAKQIEKEMEAADIPEMDPEHKERLRQKTQKQIEEYEAR